MPPINQNKDEFAPHAAEWDPRLSRRSFLKFSAASLGLWGLSACNSKRVITEIVPYVKQPEALAAGEFLPFATCQVIEGLATGLVIRSFEGRPIKVEGNPDHPASLGGTSAWNQAFVLDLLQASRPREVQFRGQASSIAAFRQATTALREDLLRNKGRGFRILTEISTSPSLRGQMDELRSMFPGLEWIQYEPFYRPHAALGCELALGRPLEPIYDLSRADLIVSFDADFLHFGHAPLRYARDFAAKRREPPRSFLWMAETSPTLTGASADLRLAVSPSELEALARALFRPDSPRPLRAEARAALENLERRVRHAGNRVVFLAGDQQPPWVHAICQALNVRAQAVHRTVRYVEPPRPVRNAGLSSLKRLTEEINAHDVHTLICIGGNPAFNAPASLDFVAALAKVPNSVRLSTEFDETAVACQWAIPLAHPLESWGDALAFDGTLTFQQPLIDPLFAKISAAEFLAGLVGRAQSSLEVTRAHWAKAWRERSETTWQTALAQGFLPESARASIPPSPRPFPLPEAPPPREKLEVVFRPDSFLHDGRFYANSWLQELPRPLTELCWGNAVLLGPQKSKELQLENEQVATLEVNGRTLNAPVWIQPGHPEKSITLLCGYGRAVSPFGPLGYNAYSVWHHDSPDFAHATLKPTSQREELACAQEHARLDATTSPVHEISPAEAARASPPVDPPASLYRATLDPSPEYAWGMVIDLGRCIGCKACVAACQAENNIPTVGKEGVLRSREMHWIRVDRYFRGPAENPQVFFQPVPCMHCEKAPCEPVCPVAATVHNDEGLNQMIYNRCVGTRYCSNNCPYKVRRFNFFEYNQGRPELEAILKNPDVSVRPRGVMEKCTYCVQRIQRAHVAAEREARDIHDGEVTTACQAACPAQAIEFGNLRDPRSRVSQWRRKAGHYALLEELGTRPRTTYLAKVTEGPDAP